MTIPSIHRSRWGLLSKALLGGVFAAGIMMTAAQAQITTVFYVLFENRNWTQPTAENYGIQILGSTAEAPYINALVSNGNATAAHVSYCSCYHHVFALPGGTTPINGSSPATGNASNGTGIGGSVHPSEPNYVFMEAGSNLSKYDDNDPYGSTNSVAQIATFLQNNPQYSGENLTGLLQNAGISWTSYSEGTCLLNSVGQDYNLNRSGTLTNSISPIGTRTVPLVSFSGGIQSPTGTTYKNAFNGQGYYNFAVKHTGSLFFPATNGSSWSTANLTPQNVAVSHYEPLESFASDLTNNTVSQYVVITPDQYNDGHSSLPSNTFTYNGQTWTASDTMRVAQWDNFAAQIVPEIMASPVYQAGHAAIVLWTDETETNTLSQNDFNHTLLEIVISPFAKGNSYNSTLNYTHSSDIATVQKIFGVTANTPTGYLNDAANASNSSSGQTGTGFGTGTATDLSDLFTAGTIPASIPGLNLTASGYTFNKKQNLYTQTVTVTNALSTAITNQIYLVVGNLTNTTLKNGNGTTVNNYPGNPYVNVASGLAPGASALVTLQFAVPSGGPIQDTMNAINTAGTP